MNLIKHAQFLIVLTLFSCTTEDEVTSNKIKEKEGPSVFDVTKDILKTLDNIDDKFELSEELLNKVDTTNIDFKIEPVYFDSSKDTSGLKVIIADGG